MAKEEEFDVLTFFIYVMALLTLIVGGFALLNRSQLKKQASKLRGSVSGLAAMEDIASDDQFKEWVGRERAAGDSQGTLNEFRTLCIARAKQFRIEKQMGQIRSSQITKDRAARADVATVRLEFKGIRVEPLIRFLVTLEEEWPGCRVKRVSKLQFQDKTELWDSSIEVAIYNPSEG